MAGDLDSLQDVLCPFNHLRELDLDGSHLTGALPRCVAQHRARIRIGPAAPPHATR